MTTQVEVTQAAWTVPGAYAGPPYKSEDVTDEDGGPLWFVSIECNQGWAEVAEVCGGSPAEATARAQAIVRALHGGAIAGEAVNHIERLYRSDNEEDWLAAELLSRLTAEQAKNAEIERVRTNIATAIAFLNRGPGPSEGMNPPTQDGWWEHCRGISSLLVTADTAIRNLTKGPTDADR